MATAGQLKTKIDLLEKKLAEKGPSLSPERRRQLRKRLKRLQRSRRVAAALESRGKPKPKTAPETATAGQPPAAPSA